MGSKDGQIKIFFGYATGVGKTTAMLETALTAKSRGQDVVIGIVDDSTGEKVKQLISEFEKLEPLMLESEHQSFEVLNLNLAISRHPDVILIDHLEENNPVGCRHNKRYQDVLELCHEGIDVYTTVNVQNIESLNDAVVNILGNRENKRIPDSLFDEASQVKLVDIEPIDLIEKNKGSDYKISLDQYTALRALALKKCSDRLLELNRQVHYQTDEHVLVCLSSAPSNQKIIRAAARMAKAFHCPFTALYVKTELTDRLSTEDEKRLQANIYLATQLGASIETVYGDDIAYQIAEFARLSNVTKIVIGRAASTRHLFFRKKSLTDKLIEYAPASDIHIIPDAKTQVYRPNIMHKKMRVKEVASDTLKSVSILSLATFIGAFFAKIGFSEANIITVYILGVLVTSIVTKKQIYSLVSSVVSVVIFNFFFTEPKFTLIAYDKGDPFTFLIMFLSAFITGSLAVKLKEHAREAAKTAYRTETLFETNQLLSQAKEYNEIVDVTARQVMKLTKRNVAIYLAQGEKLSEPLLFSNEETPTKINTPGNEEAKAALWTYKNNRSSGTMTETFSKLNWLFLNLKAGQNNFGVVSIDMAETVLDAFENSVLLSMLAECALALENDQNAREKEEAAILAKNEQLRANLLRAISHDLRTPLTSISGNASNLLSNAGSFDEETKQQLYMDIYDDAMWLVNLVENLLSVTRLEDGRMQLHLACELVDDLILDALLHISRQSIEHEIIVEPSDELFLARVDARLIIQVVINIVDNAIKYTPKGSQIKISTFYKDDKVAVSIADNGPGIPDEIKNKVFEMFYIGGNHIIDSHRSLGLGLALCKSIINAHNGDIYVTDAPQGGAVFTFTLPKGEVKINE